MSLDVTLAVIPSRFSPILRIFTLKHFMETSIFTEPAPDTHVADDAFVLRHRLTNPYPVNQKRKSSRALLAKRKQAIFLHAYAQTGIVRDGLRAAVITHVTLSTWRANDSKFEQLFSLAWQEANDKLEREVYRRAVEGWEETTMVGGRKTTVRRYSDNLLALLIKSRKREFREQKVSATVNTTNNLAVVPIERLSDEEFALLQRIAGKQGPVLAAPQPRRIKG